MSRAARALSIIFLLALVASLGACQRKPQFVPVESDSTSTGDSAEVRQRTMLQTWDSGDYESAARMSAEIVADDLAGRKPAIWRVRAAQLLDSLAVGYEIAGGSCALAINFYSRSDPTAGSWPYLVWCKSGTPGFQKVEGSGMRLSNIVARGMEGQPSAPSPGIAALFLRRGGGGYQPLLMVWSLRGGSWQLTQTLGPDSLGGSGSGEFQVDGGTIALRARTYSAEPYFEECPSCPHVYTVHQFAWRPGGFERTGVQTENSTYATFVAFIEAMMASDWNRAATYVTHRSLLDAANRYGWGRPAGSWRVAPGDHPNDELVMYHGQDEAYRIHFEPWGKDWLVSGFEPVPRSID